MASRSTDRLRDCQALALLGAAARWRCARLALHASCSRDVASPARCLAPGEGPGKCEDSDSGREVEWETGTIICQQIENNHQTGD